jgi:hypothetical protein
MGIGAGIAERRKAHDSVTGRERRVPLWPQHPERPLAGIPVGVARRWRRLQPVDLTFRDSAISRSRWASGRGVFVIRSISASNLFNQDVRLNESQQMRAPPLPLHGEQFTRTNLANDRHWQTVHISRHFLLNVRRRNRYALQRLNLILQFLVGARTSKSDNPCSTERRDGSASQGGA